MDLSDWAGSLKAITQRERFPLRCTFELTDRCNLRCVHCYINQPAGSVEARSSEMNTAQVMQLLDRLAEVGCLFITLTGGEVLLRPDFAQIYRYARQLGFIVTVFTNGTLLTPEIADLLAEMPPIGVEITLYGATQETYERVTGIAGSYERCLRGIRLLMERGVKLRLKTFVITINRHELPQMKTLAAQLGVEYRYDGIVLPRLDGNTSPMQYQLSLEQVVDIEQSEPEIVREWESLVNKNGKKGRTEMVYTCGAGLNSFHVDSAGRISGCLSLRDPSFNLLEMDFQEAWTQLGKERELKRHLHTRCEDCTLGNLCDQCPAWSKLVHHDKESPVEFICQLAHLRLERLQNSAIIN
jgi:radical SAM protein with 4Fe4S-binding SPASM domain